MFKRAMTVGGRADEEPAGRHASSEAETRTEISQSFPGCLMAIGGAEDRTSDCELLRVFAELCGGTRARIALITTASGVPARSFAMYAAAFRRLGICDICELRLASHEQADGVHALSALARATGVFFTGGDQARLECLAGSRANLILRGRVAANSLVVAGTSAGAMALGPVMILGGNVRANDYDGDNQEAAEDTDDRLCMGLGLDLLPAAIIDVHFTQRRRLPRLVAAVAGHPPHLGIGIDEDTAVLVRSGRFDVLGRGEVVTVDMDPVQEAGPPVGPVVPGGRAQGMRVHRLHADDAFPLERRHPFR